MNKYLVEALCAFVPSKKYRSDLRCFLRHNADVISGIKAYTKFKTADINPKTVLIYEPNSCHGECLPSYVKHFKEQGYVVHLLTTKNLYEMDCFERVPKEFLPDVVFLSSPYNQKHILNDLKMNLYEKIFVSSSEFYYFHKKTLSTFDVEKIKDKILLMEHDVRNIDKFNEWELVENNQLYMITNFLNHPKIKEFPPVYFGDIKITPKSEDKTRFITVGALEPRRRNIGLLTDTIKELKECGFENFVVTVIGGGKLTLDSEIADYVEFKGKLGFSAMFDEMEKADFFLPLLDPNLEENRNYLQYLTTGSKQLILAFQKPCLINEEFAKVYGFNNENSIVYRENDLLGAMKKVVSMNPKKYLELSNNLGNN